MRGGSYKTPHEKIRNEYNYHELRSSKEALTEFKKKALDNALVKMKEAREKLAAAQKKRRMAQTRINAAQKKINTTQEEMNAAQEKVVEEKRMNEDPYDNGFKNRELVDKTAQEKRRMAQAIVDAAQKEMNVAEEEMNAAQKEMNAAKKVVEEMRMNVGL